MKEEDGIDGLVVEDEEAAEQAEAWGRLDANMGSSNATPTGYVPNTEAWGTPPACIARTGHARRCYLLIMRWFFP